MSSIAIQRAAPANPVNTAVATAQIFTMASNPLLAASVSLPGKLAIEQKRFTLRAEGNATVSTAAYTIKATLFGASALPSAPLTPANWTLLGAGTARAVAAAGTVPWWIEANLIMDSTSGLLQGTFQQLVNNLFDAAAAITNQVTGLNGTNVTVTQATVPIPPADPVAWFAVGITFGTAGANSANLANFEIGF